MKVTNLKTMILAGLMFLGVGCNRDTIDSDYLTEDSSGNNNIYRNYRVHYDENQNQTLITATLSVEDNWGSTIKLNEPASLRINGSRPRMKSDEFDGGEIAAFYAGFIFPPAWLFMGVSGTTYHETLNGKNGDINFVFTDTTGTRFYDTTRVPSLHLSAPGSATKAGFSMNLSGLSATSKISVRLTQGEISEYVSASGQYINVTASDLIQFQPGEIAVRVEVKRETKIASQGKSQGGEVDMIYTFATKNIQLRY